MDLFTVSLCAQEEYISSENDAWTQCCHYVREQNLRPWRDKGLYTQYLKEQEIETSLAQASMDSFQTYFLFIL